MIDQLKKQIADLTILTEYQDTLLRECNKAIHESMRLLDDAANPYWLGKSKERWDRDRQMHMHNMKRLITKVRARDHGTS